MFDLMGMEHDRYVIGRGSSEAEAGLAVKVNAYNKKMDGLKLH